MIDRENVTFISDHGLFIETLSSNEDLQFGGFNGALLTVYLYMLYPIATFQKAGTCLDDHQSMAKQQHGETANQKLCE